MLLQKLYVRIWLAVVLAVAMLTFLVGAAWRLTAEAPFRDVVVRNEAGVIIGKGQARLGRQRPEAGASTPAGEPADDAAEEPENGPRGRFGGGPEFLVRMHDGQTVHMHIQRPPRSPWSQPPFGFIWTLVLVAVAVALATYPIIRKLTRRLERLQRGVEKWGGGDLSTRLPVGGQDEVAFLARRFNEAAERIQALVRSHENLLASQKSLLANASHELRSPLTRIRMGLELIGPTASAASRDEVARNINELDQLIDEILLASRLDAQEADLGSVESVDLMGLAAEECARVQAELDVDALGSKSELAVPGVAKLLRRAVRNLLENARRHGAGEVELKLLESDGHAVVQVCDHGPGVPAEFRERIFEPFYRLPGATERDGGVGLGLALVKAIALRHDGSVTCENAPHGGACFTLTLPMAPKPAPRT